MKYMYMCLNTNHCNAISGTFTQANHISDIATNSCQRKIIAKRVFPIKMNRAGVSFLFLVSVCLTVRAAPFRGKC